MGTATWHEPVSHWLGLTDAGLTIENIFIYLINAFIQELFVARLELEPSRAGRLTRRVIRRPRWSSAVRLRSQRAGSDLTSRLGLSG